MPVPVYPCRTCTTVKTGHRSGLCQACRNFECSQCKTKFIWKATKDGLRNNLCTDCNKLARNREWARTRVKNNPTSKEV